MPCMRFTSYNPKETEEAIANHWKNHATYEKAKDKNKGNRQFYFLDGPPYTSGKVHIGTAWNKALKDAVLRYKRMRGLDVWDRAGYDMHGLPTENATQKKLGLKTKGDIEAFGVGKFIASCKKLCIENMQAMSADFERMGVWMDFEHAYQSITDEFINGEWWLIKRAHEMGKLYKGYRSTAWDWQDETACAKHELEYQTVTETSIFVKFPVAGKEKEFFIIWTTTPWTIPFNLGIMVNPALEYVRAKVDDEVWILAKGLAPMVVQAVANRRYDELESIKGDLLAGMRYVHPFHLILGEQYDSLKKEHPNVHTIVLSEEYVTLSAGSGLVHMAPGCGPEDYEVGHRNNIPAWNLLLPDGRFPDTMGDFAGLHARHDNGKFIQKLEELGAIIAKTEVEHEYPFAQRSKQPVVFRATQQWFLKIEDMKERMVRENEAIHWVPKAAFNAFDSWLKNLRDNSISKQRFWGVPLPVWMNEKDDADIIVVGSKEELQGLSGKSVADMHLPDIDAVVIEKDGKKYRRVPDVLDVWVDAGTASWNCLYYPGQKELFERLYPADFILEGKDQIRGWFNLLMVASMIALERPSFKACYMHGFVQDAQGRKMSKSFGNVISPYEVIDELGADTLRFYMIGGARAGTDINYNPDEAKVKHKQLIILWNLHKYLIDLCENSGINPVSVEVLANEYGTEEKYILSRLHHAIREVTALFEEYRVDEVPDMIEALIGDLSRSYIHFIREKIVEDEEEKKVVAKAIFEVLVGILQLLAPVAPFITEAIFLNLKGHFSIPEESVHHLLWPNADEQLISAELEEQVGIAEQAIQAILAGREKVQLGVRWPLKEVVVVTADSRVKEACTLLAEIIRRQTNVKELHVQESLAGVEVDGAPVVITQKHIETVRKVPSPYVEVGFGSSYLYLSTERSDALDAEGYARELMRRVQAIRKKAGMVKSDAVRVIVMCDAELKKMLEPWASQIMVKVGAVKVAVTEIAPVAKHEHHAQEKIKGKVIELWVEKVSL